MDLERVAAVIRPRPHLEAIDLGFRMARTWWRPIYAVAGALGAGLTAAAAAAAPRHPWIALLLVWWLLPIMDRGTIHVVSRALFGAPPGPRETLAALARGARRALIAELTVRRLDPRRALTLPVRQLEQLHGTALRQRVAVVVRGLEEQALGLAFTCLVLELALFLSIVMFLALMIPDAVLQGGLVPDWPAVPLGVQWAAASIAIASLVALEPFYVVAGFCLYLNRRTLLEAWDIEVAFRRMARRLEALRPRPASAGAAATLLLLGGLGVSTLALAAGPAAAAETADADPTSAGPSRDEVRQSIQAILAAPEFGSERVERRFRLRPLASSRSGADHVARWLHVVAALLERLLWIVAAVALSGLAVYLALRRGAGARAPTPDARSLGVRPGLLLGSPIADLAPLEDPAAAARSLVERGELQSAVRLLYREAIARLVVRQRLAIRDASTEGDCLRLARERLPGDAWGYLRDLTRAWQLGAYAHRAPSPETMESLLGGWDTRFARAVP